MTKLEKNTLGKVATTLQLLSVILGSALNALKVYAPKQTQLIEVLGYIAAILDAIINHRELPDVPEILLPEEVKDNGEGAEVGKRRTSFAMVGDGNSEAIEVNDDYREVTAAFFDGNALDLSDDLPAVVRTS